MPELSYKTAKEAGKEAGIDSDLVDFGILSKWMDGAGLEEGAFRNIRLLAGGTQNVLVRFTRGARDYVLRRPPRHLRPKSNDSLRREGKVLSALAGSDVPHPGFIAGCFDDTVMSGAVFYLMEPVEASTPPPSFRRFTIPMQRSDTKWDSRRRLRSRALVVSTLWRSVSAISASPKVFSNAR